MATSPTTSPRSSRVKRGGVTSSKRSSSRSIDPSIVYECALRCAIRANLEQAEKKPTTTTSTSISPSSSLSNSNSNSKKKDSIAGNDDDKKSNSDKLTREIVKGLIRRLEDIYKEKDTSKMEYSDAKFRAVCKSVKKTLAEKKYRPNSTINDTVILFLRASESQLKKSDNPALWYDDLQRYVARFAEIVIQTIQQDAPSSATPELMEKLTAFCTPTNGSNNYQKRTEKRSSSSSTASSNTIHDNAVAAATATISTTSVLEEFPMIITIKNLFQMDDQEHRKKLNELLPVCTESALLNDLKKCINNVHTNQSFPGRKEDFPTAQAYENWQKKEVKQLTELMKSMMLLNPNLSIATSSEVDVGSVNLLSNRSSDSSSIHSLEQLSPFVFIPTDPKGCFRFLMSMCLDYDTENMADIAESERSKTSVLSQQSDELLRECWKTWRLSAPYRSILYLSLVKTKFDQEQLEMEDVDEAIRSLDRVMKENDIHSWSTADRDSLIRTLKGLNNSLLHELANGLSKYWKASPTWIQDIIDLLDKIYGNPLYLEAHPDPNTEFLQLEDSVKGAAVERWGEIAKKSYQYDQDDMMNLLSMADNLTKELISVAKKKFPEPIMGLLNIPEIVMARQMPYFALEMENWSYSPESKNCPVDVAFELYHKVLNLKKLYDDYGPERKTSLFKVESWFLSHVKRWLNKTNESTIEWVQNAVTQDQFQRISDMAAHSSSIVDLFSMFNQAVDFVANLEWPNDVQHCLFTTFLSKIIGQGIEQYSYTMEELVRRDVLPFKSNVTEHSAAITDTAAVAAAPTTTSSIFDKARYQIMGERGLNKEEIIPEDLSAELCVKLNDIEAARSKLDRLYQIMHVDQIAQFMRENVTLQQSNYKPVTNNYLYTIRVVRAENLQPLDANGLSDPYVTFEIEGKEITRTRTVYETLNPRWDQEFDIWLSDEQPVDVLAIVNDEDVITADEECGIVWFQLAPEYYNDYQTHELKLDLSPQGKLVLRVSMEGEKNDIQFWFGKAFRTLKRSENDMAGLIIDKMAPYLRHCLSRQVIDKLLGREKVTGFFSAFSRGVVTKQQVDPDLQDCENAISPLLDFLERNLNILNNHLSETNMQFIVLEIWKQILRTLEDVLLPPLSEHPSQEKPLDFYELHVVLKWLELLKILFNGGEDGDGIPLETLENDLYYSLLAINAAYNLETDQLIETYKTSSSNTNKKTGRSSVKNGRPADRSKTVYQSKNTIRLKKRSSAKKEQEEEGRSALANVPSSDDILRLLRMRQDKYVVEFLRQEFEKRNNVNQAPAATATTSIVEEEDVIDLSIATATTVYSSPPRKSSSTTRSPNQRQSSLPPLALPPHGITLTD